MEWAAEEACDHGNSSICLELNPFPLTRNPLFCIVRIISRLGRCEDCCYL